MSRIFTKIFFFAMALATIVAGLCLVQNAVSDPVWWEKLALAGRCSFVLLECAFVLGAGVFGKLAAEA